MAKPRVHEIAAEMGVSSSVALATLRQMGEVPRSASSSINVPVARKLRAALLAQASTPKGPVLRLPRPIGRAAFESLHGPHGALPRLVSQLLRGLPESGETELLSRAVRFRFYLDARLPRLSDPAPPLWQHELASSTGVGVVRVGDAVNLIAWVLVADQMELLSGTVLQQGGIVALEDFHLSQAAIVDGEVIVVAGRRPEAFELLSMAHAAIPELPSSPPVAPRASGPAARTSTARAGSDAQVVVRHLRRARATDTPSSSRPDRNVRAVQWMVRGHWRLQPHGRLGSERKRIWIDEHAAGPSNGRPLVRDTVGVVGTATE